MIRKAELKVNNKDEIKEKNNKKVEFSKKNIDEESG